jgi:ribosomal protein S18 acetylase RimI-like enzyme
MSAATEATIPVEEIADHERRNARGWPSETVERHYGWLLRFNGGVTRRANSVLPLEADGNLSLDVRILSAEHFYRKHNIEACFMISPAVRPQGLDGVLEARGYRVEGSSLVQGADIALVRAISGSDAEIVLARDAIESWRTCYLEGEGADRRRKVIGIMQRISAARRFAVALEGGEPVAVGLGVVIDGWMILLGMQTSPSHRRAGHGAAIVRALADWAAENGAANAVLQVEGDNDAARALYEKAGYRTLYGYHYRVAGG